MGPDHTRRSNTPISTGGMDGSEMDFEEIDFVEEFDESDSEIAHDNQQAIAERNLLANAVFPHTQSVYCAKFSKDNRMVITCGQDEVANVWSIENPTDPVIECKGHKETVCAADFNRNDQLIATCDVDGHVIVWSVQSKSIKATYDTDSEVIAVVWHSMGEILFVGCLNGSVYVIETTNNRMKVLPAQGSDLVGLRLLEASGKILATYRQCVAVWDIKEERVITRHDVTGEILCMDSTDALVALGFHHQPAQVLKMDDLKLLGQLTYPVEDGYEPYQECVKFSHGNFSDAIATGHHGGVRIYNVNRLSARGKVDLDITISHMAWTGEGILVAGDTMFGNLYIIDGRSNSVLRFVPGFNDTIMYLSLATSDDKVLVAFEDGVARLYNIAAGNVKNEVVASEAVAGTSTS